MSKPRLSLLFLSPCDVYLLRRPPVCVYASGAAIIFEYRVRRTFEPIQTECQSYIVVLCTIFLPGILKALIPSHRSDPGLNSLVSPRKTSRKNERKKPAPFIVQAQQQFGAREKKQHENKSKVGGLTRTWGESHPYPEATTLLLFFYGVSST